MRIAICLLVVSFADLAQGPAPVGIVRGSLLEWENSQESGELLIRTASNQVFRFVFDGKTYFERDKRRVAVTGLVKGEKLEIVSDNKAGVVLPYARTVHVLEAPRNPQTKYSRGRFRVYRSPLEHLIPRGDVTLAGLVSRVNNTRFILRTRKDGEKIIVLRQDTRYLENGRQVDVSALRPNHRVFVRAGKNLDDELEAYQVIWGEILQPNP